MAKKVRIGIDVGGTFTDAIMLDNSTYEVLAKHKIPTTHKEGVAVGVVRILSELIRETGVQPEDVVFIAHGTTQATNALLEGDVAHVGILGMATGADARSAKGETDVGDIELAPEKFLKNSHVFLDSKELNETTVDQAIADLRDQGAEVIVASEAFSVDNPANERYVVERAERQGMYATGGYEISQLYGLKMRTRTAAVNGSLIPTMIRTSDMTEQAVKEAGIQSSLMIMRCDGGVMSTREMKKRPILTMLSGLAAGVAGALMYEKVSDGIFFEAGGTSVDVSVIKNGKVMIKYAQVGGHKTFLQSLDVRTLGIAGGSMIRIVDNRIVDVGPRSAHIAGKDYECYLEDGAITDGKLTLICPREGDPAEYACVVSQNGREYSLTLSGAANLLGYVPEGDYARGNLECTRAAWDIAGKALGISAEEAAGQAMGLAMQKLSVLVEQLIEEYGLDRRFVTLVGGGGSASVIVNPLAEKMEMRSKIAKNAPYISTIGVALAMVRETLERTIANPTEEDIKQIRSDVMEKICRSGAKEETVDVSIEVDSRKNILRAIASGATELRQKDIGARVLSREQLQKIAADALGTEEEQTSFLYSTGRWNLFRAKTRKKALFGLLHLKRTSLAMVDREGVIRLKRRKAECLKFAKKDRESRFNPFLDANTVYSDANATIPKVFLFYREKMLDLTGMQTAKQLYSILDIETEMLSPDEEIIAVAYK